MALEVLYAVICTDHRQGESCVVGPFPSREVAYTWASQDADEKATGWDMKPGLDADGSSYISVVTGDPRDEEIDHEMVYEWQIEEMIAP